MPDVLPFTAWDLVELLRLDRHPTLLAAVTQLLPQEGEAQLTAVLGGCGMSQLLECMRHVPILLESSS
jgi:hypothetical protein